ncbi:MAG: thioredoxin family protein [Pseudomonadota bacterium]|nr:thioredoxin family protein [Pseudomonadota bacterium]
MIQPLYSLWIFILTIIATTSNTYAFDPTAHVQAKIVSKQETLHPTKPFEIGVAFTVDPGWHIYWDNAGDSGYKTSINWSFDKKVKMLKENLTPTPQIFNSEGIVDYGFKGNVLYKTIAQLENSPKSFSLFAEADIKYLVCKDVCLPGEAKISKAFTLGEDNEPSLDAGMFLIHDEKSPKQYKEYKIHTIEEGSNYHLTLDGFEGDITSAQFIPALEGMIVDSAAQAHAVSGTMHILTLEKDQKSNLELSQFKGILNINNSTFVQVESPIEFKQEITVKLPEEVTQTAVTTYSLDDVKVNRTLQVTLLLAFLGGLILNLMPCVLPVLSLKALSLLHHANHKLSWWYGLVYTLGIITTFTGLAFMMVWLKQSGESVGWGFQLQSPIFVASTALVMTLVGLQLSGVFHIGSTFGRLQNLVSGHGTIPTFFSGMLITVVATPCTAPFMASAVAFALTQPSEIIFLVFAALGLGLAFPYLAMTFMPVLLRLLPKPGAWEVTFQNFLAFPMYATVLWLLWVYGQQTSLTEMYNIILGLFTASFCVWIFGRTNTLSAGFKKKVFGFIFLIIGIIAFYFSTGILDPYIEKHLPKGDAQIEWQKWSRHEVEKGLSQGRPVFVNFTADWCITCKINEKVAFSGQEVAKFVESKGILMLKADWTMQDQTIAKELEMHGRSGVPLYLMYTPQNPLEPKKLPQTLTASDFKSSL